jgi:hypothetical protein
MKSRLKEKYIEFLQNKSIDTTELEKKYP